MYRITVYCITRRIFEIQGTIVVNTCNINKGYVEQCDDVLVLWRYGITVYVLSALVAVACVCVCVRASVRAWSAYMRGSRGG